MAFLPPAFTSGGMITKLHAVTDPDSCPISFFPTVGRVSDYTGAAALLDGLPKAQGMLADRGRDADWFRTPPATAATFGSNGWSVDVAQRFALLRCQPHLDLGDVLTVDKLAIESPGFTSSLAIAEHVVNLMG